MKVSLSRTPAELEVRPAHVAAFRALAHGGRLRIFFLLVQSRKELLAGKVGKGVGMVAPTVSHHLDILRRARLVQSRRLGRNVFCSVRQDTVLDLVRLLTSCC